MRRHWRAVGFVGVMLGFLGAAQAETLKVGHTLAAPVAPIFIAKERGYFKAERLDVELVPFDAAGPIAVALTSGSIDFALAGSTASFYSLATRGEVQIIAGAVHEMPGWHAEAVSLAPGATIPAQRLEDAEIRYLVEGSIEYDGKTWLGGKTPDVGTYMFIQHGAEVGAISSKTGGMFYVIELPMLADIAAQRARAGAKVEARGEMATA